MVTLAAEIHYTSASSGTVLVLYFIHIQHKITSLGSTIQDRERLRLIKADSLMIFSPLLVLALQYHCKPLASLNVNHLTTR